MDTTLREMFATLAVLAAVLYFGWWGARALNDWGRNEGMRCEIGYDSVDGLCLDDRIGIEEQCSAWSAPGFCFDKSKS